MNRRAGIPDALVRVGDALRTARPSFQIVRAVVFGSSATGGTTASSDLDLLVIARGIPRKRHRRSREAVEIKRLLPDIPVDVLLMTPDEVQSNFANHNPLFLDLAEDGILVLDEDGSLARGIRETRQDIRRRGIERTEHGWRFPAEPGVVTYLSTVSNQDVGSRQGVPRAGPAGPAAGAVRCCRPRAQFNKSNNLPHFVS
jgi:predicted nucleotidyltransferase